MEGKSCQPADGDGPPGKSGNSYPRLMRRVSVMLTQRPNRVLLVVVGVLALTTIAVVALTVGRDVTSYDLDSPEGVAQTYLQATFDGDFDEAAGYFEPESDCDASDLDRAFIQSDIRISLAGVDSDAERATVRITADIPDGGPFGGYYEERHTLRLVRIDDMWKLTGIPWPLYDCTSSKP
jgi:hypothetical protein